MAYIKFKDSKDFIPAVVLPTGNNTVKITTDLGPNLSGFRLYLRDNDEYPLDNGEYESYTTLYRKGDGWYELSNDGSVYQEVAPVQPDEPRELTEEEKAELERQQKIASIQSEIETLKVELEKWDYAASKEIEYFKVGLDAGYDWNAIHAERQPKRDRIDELESQLLELLETK